MNQATPSDQDAYFEYLARCEQAFKPHAPIDLPQFFAGRAKQIQRLEDELSAPGRHVAIFGERGVGKTSLARLAYFFLRRDEEQTYFIPCQAGSTFDGIFSKVLAKVGIEFELNGVETGGSVQGRLGTGGANLGKSSSMRSTFRRLSQERRIEPDLLLQKFGDRDGLIIIDEYDRVQDSETHTRVAELIKFFSDEQSKTKIVLVGVAESLSHLIGEHESLTRSLAQLKLDRMPDDELRQIIQHGEEHLDTRFSERIKNRIVRLADGFPYFVHLLGRHACRNAARALLRKELASVVVADEEYHKALGDAIDNAEHTLVEQYEKATVTTRRKSDKFELVLWAMAISEQREVQVQDIAKNMTFFMPGERFTASSISSNLGTLVDEKRGYVLSKVRTGFYKFRNPLLRAYIRLLLERERVLVPGRQWEFPFFDQLRCT